MAGRMRPNRRALRRAIFASVALHVVIAAGVIILLRSQPDPRPAPPGIDTGLDVVIHSFDMEPRDLGARSPPDPPTPAPVAPATATPTAGLQPSLPARPGTALMPRADVVPRSLPAEVLAIISRSASTQRIATTASGHAVPAIHGALKPGQTIVYVIDSSGSMGEYAKLARARSALVATLRGQPEAVRFQVIAYGLQARSLQGSNRCEPATRANIEAVESKLALLEASGRSNHLEAIRLATASQPDLILLLTDAENLALAQFRPVLAAAGKPVRICVAKVSPSGVGQPQDLR